MVFSSLTFLYLFLPLSLILYFSIKNIKYKNYILIFISLTFYAWGEPVWVSLLLFSSFVDYFHGLIAEKHRDNWKGKGAVISSLIVNLGLLGFFKYSGFIMDNFNMLTNLNIETHAFNLPIGISFYTFQTISYVIDVYRDKIPAQRSPFKLLLYVSMFPQLIAGPIVRYTDIAKQIDNRKITSRSFSKGINRFIIGLSKKVIIANIAGELSDKFLGGTMMEYTVAGAWFGIFMFAIQIYFDFSGYSDMAIGLGKILGFDYKENFNYPYISKSASEFWRRWHISLGSFFRDYVYIPLGGNRKHYIRNLLIVWFLTGLWHGASWNFVLWGLYFGILILIERVFLSNLLNKLPKIFSTFYFVIIVLVGWVFFYFTNLSDALNILKIMFGLGNFDLINLETKIYIMNNLYFAIIAIVLSTPIIKNLVKSFAIYVKNSDTLNFDPSYIRTIVNAGLLLLSTALLVGQTYNPFLYFRF
ncbi:MAG: MBOAT family protein [Firmicutes bacterium]|nr:MBOAT family protein [Bacillota bacterium]